MLRLGRHVHKTSLLPTQSLPRNVSLGHILLTTYPAPPAQLSRHPHLRPLPAPPSLLRAGSKKKEAIPHDPPATRSLYRSLLRESYRFYDPRARLYLVDRVRSRFRAFQHWTWSRRVVSKLALARKELNRIKRANQGERPPSIHILNLAYGRTGAVRRELLRPYIETLTHPPRVPAPKGWSTLPWSIPTSPSPPVLAPMGPELSALLHRYSSNPLTKLRKNSHLSERSTQVRQERYLDSALARIPPPMPSFLLREVEHNAMAPTPPGVTRSEGRRRRRLFRSLLANIPVIQYPSDHGRLDITSPPSLHAPRLSLRPIDKMNLPFPVKLSSKIPPVKR